jgi:hypothetical protein
MDSRNCLHRVWVCSLLVVTGVLISDGQNCLSAQPGPTRVCGLPLWTRATSAWQCQMRAHSLLPHLSVRAACLSPCVCPHPAHAGGLRLSVHAACLSPCICPHTTYAGGLHLSVHAAFLSPCVRPHPAHAGGLRLSVLPAFCRVSVPFLSMQEVCVFLSLADITLRDDECACNVLPILETLPHIRRRRRQRE